MTSGGPALRRIEQRPAPDAERLASKVMPPA
jgi:hypothetical protein